MKSCSRCLDVKDGDDFHRSNKTSDGLATHCKVCDRLRVKAYRDTNLDKVKARNQAAYARDPKKNIDRSKRWRTNNLDRAKELGKDWRTANIEQEKIRRRARFDANREAELKSLAERMKDHRHNNPEKELARKKEWKRNNRDIVNAQNAKRRASRIRAAPAWLTKEHLVQITLFYTAAKNCEWFSNESLHVDHIVPLQGKNVCGLHVPWNLQVIPASENEKKNNSFDENAA